MQPLSGFIHSVQVALVKRRASQHPSQSNMTAQVSVGRSSAQATTRSTWGWKPAGQGRSRLGQRFIASILTLPEERMPLSSARIRHLRWRLLAPADMAGMGANSGSVPGTDPRRSGATPYHTPLANHIQRNGTRRRQPRRCTVLLHSRGRCMSQTRCYIVLWSFARSSSARSAPRAARRLGSSNLLTLDTRHAWSVFHWRLPASWR
jgi:hypothetical protein